jgi:hypothetical protein
MMAAATVAGVVCSRPTSAQVAPVRAVHGVIVGRADGVGILSAQVQHLRTNVRTRSDERGMFRLDAVRGDTLAVRALGFRATRVVVANDSITIALEALPTVLPVFTTVGQW